MDIDSGLLAPVWAGTGLAELVSDEAWLRAMLDVEVALARAQAELGVIPAAAAERIADGARTGRFDLAALAEQARGAANPVVALVKQLTEAAGPEAAEYVHRGGTSQDIFDSASMLVAKHALDAIEADLRATAGALAELASAHRETPMAGRTLTQHAVPISFGLKAGTWLQLTLDALDRVRAVVLPAQLGGAAGTLASYEEYAGRPNGPELLAAFARQLGLAVPVLPWHTARTPIADLGAALAFTTGALGKLAVDVQTLSRTEIGEVTEPAAEGRGVSSAMPQKRNPVLATLLLSAAKQVPAHALVLAQSLVAEDERAGGGWHAEWQPLRESLRLTAGAARTAAELTGGLEVHPGRMRENLALTGRGIVSERLTIALASTMGKAAAKELLARLNREGSLADAEELRDLPDLSAPEEYLGASAALVGRVLARAEEVLHTKGE
ncbi:3-carboxy-cis,cis-muconate cycloisomerase [Amycolatopsis sp. 195334CR]|uniref:3-carboxy-cis,cis-muconate cycloisomerase n=1 Tax=Amycolatopsis sp. 195334CR TaxID=2814588 RepID=UPI001A8DEDD4|nr:3-carboxy-cis,cis-muconate cycloisomerase [Amycolatopsis sp. 195334CR]MBN6037821.1 3-carboxy-cis,cis-muconate cycloisomerase [Amycolatopsis sp. 195334CR]